MLNELPKGVYKKDTNSCIDLCKEVAKLDKTYVEAAKHISETQKLKDLKDGKIARHKTRL